MSWSSAQIASAGQSAKDDETMRNIMAAIVAITAMIKATIMVGIAVEFTTTGKV